MAQIGGVHPDKLLPWWHPALHLTPEEIEAIGRIGTVRLPERIKEEEFDLSFRLEGVPPIPPRRQDRHEWERSLTRDQSMRLYEYRGQVKDIAAMKKALASKDAKSILYVLTRSAPLSQRELALDLRPAWVKELQAIRDAYERRIDDAIEQAVQAKAAELTQD